MKALVYQGPGSTSWQEVPDPEIRVPTDVIVRVDTTTVCGTDLHIVNGHVPEVRPGTVLGHEGVGTVLETGSAVSTLQVGDRVVLSCVSSCGRCSYCRQGLYAHCLADEGASGVGWLFGHLIDGTHAEKARVPFADTSVHKLPSGVTDAAAVMLSDILPTGFEIGVRYGGVKPGDTVAVIGAGPIGLAAMLTSQLYGAGRIIALDLDSTRLRQARKFGATDGIDSSAKGWREELIGLTDGLGVDVAIEAAGVPAAFAACTEMVRPGGSIATVGVYSSPVELPLQELWSKDIRITTGLVSTNSTPMLLRLVAEGRLPADRFATHRLHFHQMREAYDIFAHASANGALKVVVSR